MKEFDKKVNYLLDEAISFYAKKGPEGYYIDARVLEEELKQYASLCIEVRGDQLECFNETNTDELSIIIAHHLREESEDSLWDMDQLISKTACKYYFEEFEEALQYRLTQNIEDELVDQGYSYVSDKTNGDHYWQKGLQRAQV
jgi:hypothetical protein